MRGLRSRFCGRIIALFAIGIAALCTVASGGANHGPSAAGLRRDVASLQARTHQALLDLYAAETGLARARAHHDALAASLVRLRKQQLLMRHELAIAGHAHAISQQQLAQRLKALYEQARPDPLLVILGARSFDEALTSIDALDRSARQDTEIVQQTAATRHALDRLSTRLAVQTQQLVALEQQAAASVDALTRAESERASLVSTLRTKEQLSRRRLATLESVVQAAEVKTQTLSAAAAASAGDTTSTSADPTPSTTVVPAPVAPVAPVAPGGRTITVTSTGYALPGHTSTGLPVGWGIVAVDPAVIPLGTHLSVPGYGDAVAADTGGAVRGTTIDLWFPTLAQARAWGRRTITIGLH